ncbi:MAG: hypothetical protein B7Y95_04845 [Rhizobiales bacterium 32-66-11]|nr:MAG: hypothetical protein B7Y95_04845 [Rhizobiales bacterium 32-66-11]
MRPAAALAVDLGCTFASGAAAGCLLMAGVVTLDLHAIRPFLDILGDGIDLRDTAAVAFIFGQLAVLARYVLPGLLIL